MCDVVCCYEHTEQPTDPFRAHCPSAHSSLRCCVDDPGVVAEMCARMCVCVCVCVCVALQGSAS